MIRKATIPILLLCLSAIIYQTGIIDILTIKDQPAATTKSREAEDEKEEESLLSNPDHARSMWFREVNSARPNIYRMREAFSKYFGDKPVVMSYETNAYIQFLQQNMANVDANGYVIPYQPTPGSPQTSFTTAAIGNAWQMSFTKWKTQQANGNDGVGVVRSVAIDPGNVNNVLIGATTAGLWRTSNKGVTWTWVSQGIPHVRWVNDIAYIRNTPSVVYAGTDMGVIKSTDGGNSWSYTALNTSANFPVGVGDLIWLGTTVSSIDTVYATVKMNNQYILKRTHNGGTTWTDQYTFAAGTTVWDMKIHPRNRDVVYVLTADPGQSWINFYKSTDGGKNFVKINNGYPADIATQAHRARIAVTPANANVVYIAIGYNGGDQNDKISFFKSTDAGNSFTKRCCGSPTSPLVNANGTTDFLYETCHLAQITWNFAFAVSATDENFIACAANKLKVSNDGGATWKYDLSNSVVTGSQYDNYPQTVEHTGVHGDHHGLAIQGLHIWNTNDGGVYYSGDGGQTVVKDVSDGLMIHELWGFGTAFKKEIWAVGLNHNAINVRDDGAYGGWVRFGGADAMAANVNPIDDQYLYIHPWGHHKVKRNTTQNSGHQFSNLGIELGYITLDNIEFHPNHYYTMYASDYGDRNMSYRIAKSTNNAGTWQIIKSFSDIQKNAVAVKLSYADPKYVYAVVEPNQVWRSTDEGVTWAAVSPPSSLIGTFALWRLAVSDKNPNHIWVTVKGNQNTIKLIRSTDGGLTWQDYSTGLPAYAITSLIYQRGSDDGLYVGTTYGVYYRKNGMTSWQQFGTGLPATQVSFMSINYALGKLRIGTARGIWQNDLAEITPPKANLSANKTKLCPTVENATVQFADYSVLHNDAQTTYSWSFPGGTPSTSTSERPLISYANAAPGKYSVTLTVKDQYGTSTQTLTDFITIDCAVYSDCSSPRDIPKSKWSIVYADSYEPGDAPANCIDGDAGTIWHTPWSSSSPPYPHEVQVNLGAVYSISQVKYLPRQDQQNGRIAGYELYVSTSSTSWGTAVSTGTFPNTATEQVITFAAKSGQYIRLKAISEVNRNVWASVAEIGVVGCLPTSNTCTLQSIPRTGYSVHQYDSQEPRNEAIKTIDGKTATFWHTAWSTSSPPHPHFITINLGNTYNLGRVTYTPRSDQSNGRIKDYKIETSLNATSWTQATAGVFPNVSAVQQIDITPVQARYVRITALSEVNGNYWTSIAELSFSACSGTTAASTTPVNEKLRAESETSEIISVFPSPGKSTITLALEESAKGFKQVKIFSAAGTVMSASVITQSKTSMELDISNLSKGWYVIHVVDGGGRLHQRKFIVE
jgi:PKD repeat protein/photosystem II stability/assembly factor-like uncharacterized protein